MFKGFAPSQGASSLSNGLSSAAFPLLAPNGTVGAPSYSFSGETNTGIFLAAAGVIRFAISAGAALDVTGTYIAALGEFYIGSDSSCRLVRDAAAVLALKNGTTAQEFRVYGTTTGSKYTELAHNGTDGRVGTSSGRLFIGAGTAGNVLWIVNTSGHVEPNGANLYEIGNATNMVKGLFHGAGTGAGYYLPSGKITVNTTGVGNVDAGEDTLQTYSLPLNSLSAAGKGLHISAWGTTANNANAKTIKLYLGATAILTNALTASIAGVWRIEADVFSTGTDAQDSIAQLVTTGTAGVALNDLEFTTSTEDDGAAIVIKTTGEATTTNDIVSQGLLVTFIS